MTHTTAIQQTAPLVSARSRTPLALSFPWSTRDVSVLGIEAVVPLLPAGCANCGATAGLACKETHGARALLVPYCTRCFRGVERERTRRFAAIVSSWILGITLLLTLPRLWSTGGVVGYGLLVLLVSALPIALTVVLSPKLAQGQSSSGRAVWYLGPKRVACCSFAWAKELGRLNDVTPTKGRARTPLQWSLLSGPALLVALVPGLFAFQHPEVVVINLSDAPFHFLVDGQDLARVDVTSLESAAAGVHLRVSAGERDIQLKTDDGKLIHQERLAFSAGSTHLYAPASDSHCFWLEQDAYGKVDKPKARYRPLPDGTFWTLPVEVDHWFAKNPDPSPDERSTGGTLTALRHARCAEAPEGAR